MVSPVVLGQPTLDSTLRILTERVSDVGDDVAEALLLAAEIGDTVAVPGGGATVSRWQTLASLGAADLTAARVVEPHLDALAILDEARTDGFPVDLTPISADRTSTWGVFAAEGPGGGVRATSDERGWTLNGHKPWCSLAGRLSHALITADTPQGRRLFGFDLRDAGVEVQENGWVAKGLANVISTPIDLRDVRAVPVGPPMWYLERPGFAWGGIGVAAVWLGGAIAVARRLYDKCAARPEDVLALMHLGAVDTALSAAGDALAASAVAIDGRCAGDEVGETGAAVLAARVRGVIASAAELTLGRVGHALGPGPLALDGAHARRVADLQLYLRQHHGERDDAALGSMLITRGTLPW